MTQPHPRLFRLIRMLTPSQDFSVSNHTHTLNMQTIGAQWRRRHNKTSQALLWLGDVSNIDYLDTCSPRNPWVLAMWTACLPFGESSACSLDSSGCQRASSLRLAAGCFCSGPALADRMCLTSELTTGKNSLQP